MSGSARVSRTHIAARFDPGRAAVLDELVPLRYAKVSGGLPPYVRAASALRRFRNRLVIVQDDVNALALVGGETGSIRVELLPPHASGGRVFDDTLGNKHHKLDLEAAVALSAECFVAFGSGSSPEREQLVVWSGLEPPRLLPAPRFYSVVRAALAQGDVRLNVEGAVAVGETLQLFHRGNDARGAGRTPQSAIVELDAGEFASWLDGRGAEPRVARVTTVHLGAVHGVPFGFTDAVALEGARVAVLACAEDSACATADGPVLGCRIGMLDAGELTTADVCDSTGRRTLLKLEGIERRPGSSTQFDVAVDLDRPAAAAMLGRLTWEWN